MHALEEFAPDTVEYFPAPQSRQLADEVPPGNSLYFPFTQSWQSPEVIDMVGELEYLPASQGMQ